MNMAYWIIVTAMVWISGYEFLRKWYSLKNKARIQIYTVNARLAWDFSFDAIIFVRFLFFACFFSNQAKPYSLDDNHAKDNYWYSISVQTGYVSGCSTTSEVFIKIKGSDGTSVPRKLLNPLAQCFMKGETNVFLLSFPYGFGKIEEVEVWHNNSGESPGWFLLQIQVGKMMFASTF